MTGPSPTTVDPFEVLMEALCPGEAPDMKAKLDSLCETLVAAGWHPGRVAGWDEFDTRTCYECLIRAGLRWKSLPVACVTLELVAARQPDTVRGIMYAVVSAGWLPDTSATSYGRIQRLLNSLRKKRVVPFEWIVDNVRETRKPSSWTGLDDFADTVANAYRKDFWAQLDDYVCVIVEKDTVAGRIQPVTDEYDIALHALRGFSSTSFAYEIGSRWRRIEKPITAYYIGDHDPSGREIETSLVFSLEEYSGGKSFDWTRLAVTPGQFDQFAIRPLKPKKRDTRTTAFIDRYGPDCAEVEAIPADALRGMVREAIESHIPWDQWERLREIEQEERQSWHDVMARFGDSPR